MWTAESPAPCVCTYLSITYIHGKPPSHIPSYPISWAQWNAGDKARDGHVQSRKEMVGRPGFNGEGAREDVRCTVMHRHPYLLCKKWLCTSK